LELGIEVGLRDGLPDGIGNRLGITTSPSFGDARLTLAHTSLLAITLKSCGAKRTDRTQRELIIHTTLDDGFLGTKLGQQFGNAAGINFCKTHGNLLGTAKTK
jgi:hypothetical protein